MTQNEKDLMRQTLNNTISNAQLKLSKNRLDKYWLNINKNDLINDNKKVSF